MTAIFNKLMFDQFTNVERERQKRQQDAWCHYYGEYPQQLKPLLSDPKAEDNTTVNYLRLIVDQAATMLFGFNLDLEVDGQRDTPEEKWLRQAMKANEACRKLISLAINGGVCGHAFLEMNAPQPRRGHNYPSFSLWDPACVSVRYEASDYELVNSYAYTWNAVTTSGPLKAKVHRRLVEWDDEGWIIRDQEGDSQIENWSTVQSYSWPYQGPPVLDCQNLPRPNEFWGTSDIEPDVIALAQRVCWVSSNISRILRFHGHPKTWGRGIEAKEMRFGPDDVILFPSPEAELSTLEMKGDLEASMRFFKLLREALFAQTRTPEVSSGKLEDIGQLSGLALQILYRGLMEQIELKRQSYGPLLENLALNLLEMGGFGREHEIKAQWPAILPYDRRQESETGYFLTQLGVSRDTVLKGLGYDPVTEEEKRSQEPEMMTAANAGRDPGMGTRIQGPNDYRNTGNV